MLEQVVKKYTVESISRTLDFSKIPITRTQSRFPWICFTVILPPIFRTSRFLEPIFVSLGGSRNRHSTIYLFPRDLNVVVVVYIACQGVGTERIARTFAIVRFPLLFFETFLCFVLLERNPLPRTLMDLRV